MEQPSELQQFLAAHRDEGEHQDEGEFTVAREKALAKLAEFQLPFDGGWALKIVQAAVAAGTEAIRVDQTYSETRFYFEISTGWSLSDIEDAFYEPEPSLDRALDHLKRGLWAACLNKQRPFQLNLPGVEEMLVWTGEKLTQATCQARFACLYLAVSHRPASQSGFLGKLDFWTSADSNAAVVKALAENAFTCPVPLTVDSRRLDSLQFCPRHGMSSENHPLVLRTLETDLESLRLSPGTFRESMNKEQYQKELRYQVLSSQLPRPEQIEGVDTSLAYLLTYHAEKVRQEDGKYRWVDKTIPSQCYWIQDGVCVDRERLPVASAPISAGLFISASGIATDLTSLRLQKTEERERRLMVAIRALCEDIITVEPAMTQKASRSGNEGTWAGGALMMIGGAALLWAAPPLGAVVFSVGGLTVRGAHQEAREFKEHLDRRFEQTRATWRDLSSESYSYTRQGDGSGA